MAHLTNHMQASISTIPPNINPEPYDLKAYFQQHGSTSEDLKKVLHRERTKSISGIFIPSHPFVITSDHQLPSYSYLDEHAKVDISAKDIRKEGLRTLLCSSVPLGYFLYHLLQEYSSENLFFYLAVESYETHVFNNEQEQQEVARNIYTAYLTRNADLEINLEDRIHRVVRKQLDLQTQHSSTGHEFESAKRHVFSLLSVSYHRFRTSSVWNVMESKCGSSTMIHDQGRAQTLVVNLLMSFIENKNKFESATKSSRDKTNSLIHTFCQLCLPLGYAQFIKEEEDRKQRTRPRSKSVAADKKSHFMRDIGKKLPIKNFIK
ncbi:RGS domain-containing protein [Pilobolus umbonatus]|nr:RGS domain-containing protein [Pilobolus umbonatus]